MRGHSSYVHLSERKSHGSRPWVALTSVYRPASFVGQLPIRRCTDGLTVQLAHGHNRHKSTHAEALQRLAHFPRAFLQESCNLLVVERGVPLEEFQNQAVHLPGASHTKQKAKRAVAGSRTNPCPRRKRA